MVGKRKVHDYSKIKIEKDIDFPEDIMASHVTKLVSRLEIGDSFVIDKPSMYGYISAMARKSNIQLRLRNVGTSTHAEYRVWRLK